MPRIQLPEGLTGMAQLRAYRPDVSDRLGPLAGLLLQPTDTLSCGDRELIATFVSSLNSCNFCQLTHGKAAAQQLGDDEQLVEDIKCNYQKSCASPKLKALLAIAEQVQQGGAYVTPEAIRQACAIGATEMDVHDTILIAAAFCMFNRYIGGLDVSMPANLTAELRPQGSALTKLEGEENLNPSLTSAQTAEPTLRTSTTVETSNLAESGMPQPSKSHPSGTAKESLEQELVVTQSIQTNLGQTPVPDTSTVPHPPPTDDDLLKSPLSDSTSSQPPLPPTSSLLPPLTTTTTTSTPTKDPPHHNSLTNTFTPAQRQELINIIQQVVAATIRAQSSNTNPASLEVSERDEELRCEKRPVEVAAYEVQ